MKHFKNFVVRGSLMILLALGLAYNAAAGDEWAIVDRPEIEPEIYWIEPIRPKPIYLMPDFEITHVEREYEDNNPPYLDYYRYYVTITNRGGYCDGSQGPIRVEGEFTHTDHNGAYTRRTHVRLDPPGEFDSGDEVTVYVSDPIIDTDNPDWWITVIRIDDEKLYIESDERNNVWSCDHTLCDW